MKAGGKIVIRGETYEAFPDPKGVDSTCNICEIRPECSAQQAPCDFDQVHFVRPDEALKRRLRGEPV